MKTAVRRDDFATHQELDVKMQNKRKRSPPPWATQHPVIDLASYLASVCVKRKSNRRVRQNCILSQPQKRLTE